jgi:hypothetical protein
VPFEPEGIIAGALSRPHQVRSKIGDDVEDRSGEAFDFTDI